MLGGQEVNITGPCFRISHFYCKWGDGYKAQITLGETTILGTNMSQLRGRCVQPLIFHNGRLNLSVSLDNKKTFEWRAEYTIGIYLFNFSSFINK